MGKYLDATGLQYFWGKIKAAFAAKVHTHLSADITDSKNMTAIGHLNWVSQADGRKLATMNEIAYWNGRYDATRSNLEYCKKGAFGNLAVKDSLTYTDVGAAPISHASTADTYGVGTGNKYGHVKLIDSRSTLLTEDDGYAATPASVGLALNDAKSYADSVAGEVNQNAFSNVKVGSTTIASGAETDTLELVAGTNVTLTPDATNKKVTINATSGGTVTPDLDLGAKDLTSTSLANGTQKTIGASITVPAGKWIITICVRFNSNATGQRAAWLSTSNNGNAAVVAATSRVAAVSGGQTFVHFSYPCSLTTNTTYYVVGYQDSGTSINALGYARWLGVAD